MKTVQFGVFAMMFAWAGAASAQSSPAVGLPIDDEQGTPGLIVVWPDEGCPECAQTPELVAAYEGARDAILGNSVANRATLNPRIVRIVSYSKASGYKSKNVTLAQISERLKGCSPTAQGMLPPNLKADELKTFGIGADCPGSEDRAFMSLSFKNNRLVTVFLMPDRPFIVQ